MTESQYQSKIMKELEKKGWYVIKLITTNKNGIPDLLALKKGELPSFIEVKGVKGKTSALQDYRIKELQDYGFKAEVRTVSK